MLYYWQLFIKIRKYGIFKMSKFSSFDHALDEKSFSILFCLPLNIYQTNKSSIKIVIGHLTFFTLVQKVKIIHKKFMLL